ncbi:MAG: PPK2 family polyphosphate kinase [Candidatus Methylacidiphilales bacterium]
MKHPILSHIPTYPTEKISKLKAKQKMIALTETLILIQDKLFAQQKYKVLIILQGMDTAGKDSAVKHVFYGVNPAGCDVQSFKAPTQEELAHHFLWRINNYCPSKGMIQIFNRSQYEDVLIPLMNETLTKSQLAERCNEINNFETGLINNDTILIKFFLHISQNEQSKRLAERKTNITKKWKYQKSDVKDIANHNEFLEAYQFVFKHCSKPTNWFVVPADKKWYKNYFILDKIVKTLQDYKIEYPS